MKSYNQALNEIYSKADEQINKIRQRKQKRKKMLATVVPVCFLMVICLSIGFGILFSVFGNLFLTPFRKLQL